MAGRPGVFLCHSSEDKVFVRRLADDLRSAGVRVWLDEAEIRLGDSLINKIQAGIDEMRFVAIVLTPASVSSPWVQKELDVAMNQEVAGRRIKVLPLLLRSCDLPAFLVGKLYADFRREEDYLDSLRQILERVDLSPGRDISLQAPHQSRARSADTWVPQSIVWLAVGSAILAMVLLIYRYFLFDSLAIIEPENLTQQSNIELLRMWRSSQPDLIDRYGPPNRKQWFAQTWQQFFEKGRVVYDVSGARAIVLTSSTGAFRVLPITGASVNSGDHNNEVNQAVLVELLTSLGQESDKQEYVGLVEELRIQGGIGFLYIRERLRPELGLPLGNEESEPDLLFAKGDGYDLIVGLKCDRDDLKYECLVALDYDRNQFLKYNLGTRFARD